MSGKAVLPPGWALTSTRTLLSFVTSGSRGWAQYYSQSGTPFIRIGDLDRNTMRVDWRSAQRVTLPPQTEGTRTRLQPGDLLISITADLGIIGLAPSDLPEAYINQHIALARPALIEPRYLGWFLASENGGQKQFRDLRRGATKAGLGLDDIRSVEVPLAPLPEQHRIVAEIEKHFTRLDDAVATLKRVQASLKQARASVLKAAVEGRLVPTEAELARAEGRTYEPASVLLERILSERKRRHEETNGKKKYKPPVEPETRGLPPLPEGWRWVTVDQLIREKLRNGKSARATEGQGGIRTLSLSAVTERSFTDANTKLTVATSEQVDGLWLEPGDILVQRSNTPELVGTAALFSGPRDWAVFPDLLIRVRLCSDAVPSWVECVLRAPRIREFFKQRAQGIAGSMPKIDQETVARAVIPLPPKQEQSRIVAEVSRRLSVLDALDQTIRLNLSRCAHLRQSILKRAFSGKLVPQDAADEPASALLERIRATAVP